MVNAAGRTGTPKSEPEQPQLLLGNPATEMPRALSRPPGDWVQRPKRDKPDEGPVLFCSRRRRNQACNAQITCMFILSAHGAVESFKGSEEDK